MATKKKKIIWLRVVARSGQTYVGRLISPVLPPVPEDIEEPEFYRAGCLVKNPDEVIALDLWVQELHMMTPKGPGSVDVPFPSKGPICIKWSELHELDPDNARARVLRSQGK